MHAIEGSSNVPAFLTKLWRLVDDDSTNDLISWTPVSIMVNFSLVSFHELDPDEYHALLIIVNISLVSFHQLDPGIMLNSSW